MTEREGMGAGHAGLELLVIGCGDAFGSGGRNPACFLVRGGGMALLLDCGPASVPAMKRLGVAPASLDGVLLSHLHGDHFGGVPFLFLEARYLQPRDRPLAVAGPPGVAGRVEALAGALYRSGSALPDAGMATFHELSPGVPCRIGAAEVHPFAVRHAEDETCLGLKLVLAGRTVVYSGDTGWCAELEEAARDADLLLWECSYLDEPGALHTRLQEVEERREGLGCRRLLLVHLGPRVLEVRHRHRLPWAADGMRVAL